MFAFVGHAETLPDPAGSGADLYLLPRNGAVPPDSDTGYLLGERLRELPAGPAAIGLDGLLLLVDACSAGVGALQRCGAGGWDGRGHGGSLGGARGHIHRVARGGCFSASLTALLREGMPNLSSITSKPRLLLDRVVERCPQQEPPLRFAMSRGRRTGGDPGLWLARNPEATGRWALAGTAAGGHAVRLTRPTS